MGDQVRLGEVKKVQRLGASLHPLPSIHLPLEAPKPFPLL